MLPGRGTALCAGTTRAGRSCCNLEVEGFGFCLHHVPDDELADAEQVVGFERCRTRFGQPDACRFIALSYVDSPPVCKVHLSGFARTTEAIAFIRGQALDRFSQLRLVR